MPNLLTNCHSSTEFKKQSFKYIDSWSKLLLFRTRHLWNSTTELILMYKQLSSKVGINLQTLVQRWQFYCLCTKQDQKGLNSTQGQKTRPTRTIWSKRSTMYGRYKKSKNSMHLKSSMRSKCTVAVWTEKTFIPLLTHPQGSQGCQNIRIFLLQIKLLSFCTKIDPNCRNFKKP